MPRLSFIESLHWELQDTELAKILALARVEEVLDMLVEPISHFTLNFVFLLLGLLNLDF